MMSGLNHAIASSDSAAQGRLSLPSVPTLGRRLGRYELLTELASGGMAAVYIARACGVAGFERLMAVKVLHPHLAQEQEFVSMFLDEARLAARIRHTNVVPTLDINESGDGYFLVMEYVEGDHFGALLRRVAEKGERLPTALTFRVVIDALQGLAAAHNLVDEAGEPLHLVHRDVSPNNILVGTDGIAKLTDFGVAKAEVRIACTQTGQFKGKLTYMAPEQALTGLTDRRSDLFGMGIILWEALTGQRLFKGNSHGETLTKLLDEPIPKPSDVNPELCKYDDVVMRALEREPDLRYQDADEFIEDLESVCGPSEIASTREVANMVAEVSAAKLHDESTRLREALDELRRMQLVTPSVSPMPSPRREARPAGFVRRAQLQDGRVSVSDVFADRVGIYLQSESQPSDRLIKVVIALLLAVLIAGGWLFVRLNERLNISPAPVTEPGAVAETGTETGTGTETEPETGTETGTGTGTEAETVTEPVRRGAPTRRIVRPVKPRRVVKTEPVVEPEPVPEPPKQQAPAPDPDFQLENPYLM